MNPRTVIYIVAGVAGLVIASRVLAGAASVGGAVSRVAGAVGGALNTINPFNPGNVINTTANTVWERVTGRPGQTIGLSVEELFTGRTPTRITYNADADDAALGAAMRANEPSYFQRRAAVRDAGPWSAVDQEDADMGAAMRGFEYVAPPPQLGAAWPASIPRRP